MDFAPSSAAPSATLAAPRNSFVTLQIGRGLAALAVAAFHMVSLMQAPEFGGMPIAWLSWFNEGHLGVDFFFVLSGFIILHAHERDIGDASRLGRYAYRRAVRIYPIYWLYLALCIAGMIAVKSAHFVLATGADWATAFSLVRFSTVELPLAQAWTLFHEIVFYAMFALMIAHRRAGIAALAMWFGAIALVNAHHQGAGESFGNVWISSANLNFLAGMLAYLVSKNQRRAGLQAASWSCVGVGVVLLVTGHWQWGVAFGLILAGVTALERPGLPVWLGFAGDASYSIYLLHEHIETYTARGLAKLSITPSTQPVLMFCIIMAMVLVVGGAAYLLVEKPLVNALRRREPAA